MLGGFAFDGSETPPRAWGRPENERLHGDEMGNTPTGVGKTTVPIIPSALYSETPPRAWGRLRSEQTGRVGHGNTPTGVGKTRVVPMVGAGLRKHPHGRGEDTGELRGHLADMETPPRAWGRRFSPLMSETSFGNTPTGVGKTQLYRLPCQ